MSTCKFYGNRSSRHLILSVYMLLKVLSEPSTLNCSIILHANKDKNHQKLSPTPWVDPWLFYVFVLLTDEGYSAENFRLFCICLIKTFSIFCIILLTRTFAVVLYLDSTFSLTAITVCLVFLWYACFIISFLTSFTSHSQHQLLPICPLHSSLWTVQSSPCQ